jgi:hypothetical protein
MHQKRAKYTNSHARDPERLPPDDPLALEPLLLQLKPEPVVRGVARTVGEKGRVHEGVLGDHGAGGGSENKGEIDGK